MKRLLSAALLVLCFTACSKRDNALIIGTDATYPPFEFKDEKGEFTGVSIEIGRALGEYLGRPVQFQNIAFDGLLAAIPTGSVDLAISSMTATDERRKSFDFTDPYASTSICLLLPKASTVQSAEDLKQGKRRIVVKIATTGEQWSRANLPNAEIVALDSDPACVMEVAKGSADAWVYDQISVMNYAARNTDTTRAQLAPIRVEQWAIALPKGHDDLKAKINAFLKDFRAKGGFEKLAKKYLQREADEMKKAGVPFIFDVSSAGASQ
jgi:polar amino acid transport system substrate-binding protein